MRRKRKQQKRLLEERLRDLQKLEAMEAAAQAEGEDGSRERAPWRQPRGQLPTQHLCLSPQTLAADSRRAAAPRPLLVATWAAQGLTPHQPLRPRPLGATEASAQAPRPQASRAPSSPPRRAPSSQAHPTSGRPAASSPPAVSGTRPVGSGQGQAGV